MNPYKSSMLLPALIAAWLFATVAGADDASVRSLRPTDVSTADQAPSGKAMIGKRPGAQQTIPRTFEQQPPLIPHAMTNFDEVSLSDNQCLECHGPDTYEKKNAPRLGDSHFRDQRTGEVSQTMSGARYQCTLCHVPQADAQPLVENEFRPAEPPPK